MTRRDPQGRGPTDGPTPVSNDSPTIGATQGGETGGTPWVAVGERLGDRYVLVAELGSGGFGSVYRARDTQLGREVALKILHGFAKSMSADELDAALQEGRSLARLQHPGIVPVFDAGRLDGLPFLSMGLVRGMALQQLLDTVGALPLPRAVKLTTQLCAALDHAHDNGLVHRDVKPVNLIVDDDTLQLIDFGIAVQHAGTEAPEWVSGTVGYIAPEVIEGARADARSDQFATAVTFCEMLSGERAFASKTPAGYVSELHSAPLQPLTKLPNGVSPRVRGVLERALSADPQARFPSCGAFAEALREAVELPRRRRRQAAGLFATAALAATAVLLWPARPLEVSSELRGLVETRDGARVEISVDDRAALTEGDWFWLDDVKVTKAAHAYVLLLDAAGDVAVLCPGPSCELTEPLLPGLPHRLPPPGQPSWQLDDNQGFESLFLLASQEPVPESELRALALEASKRIGSLAITNLRGVRSTHLPDSVEERVGKEQSVMDLLGDRFEWVRTHRVVHE